MPERWASFELLKFAAGLRILTLEAPMSDKNFQFLCTTERGSGDLVLQNCATSKKTALHRSDEKLRALRVEQDSRASDLLDIAAFVFGADRIAARGTSNREPFRWKRTITLNVETRNPKFWHRSSVRSALQDVLGVLTGDEWRFEFDRTRARADRTVQTVLFDPNRVALFSGGLDSLAGLLCEIETKRESFTLVSVNSHSQTVKRQREILRTLYGQGHHIDPVDVVLHHEDSELRDQGRSQRARSFLYFVIATLVAKRSKRNEFSVFENGITSLNLPISPVLTSTRVTRTTHPVVVRKFENLVREVFSWPQFVVELPSIYKTKAELVSPHAEAHRDIIKHTSSCARIRTGKWCGLCTACILRRQVLHYTGLAQLDKSERPRYVHDAFDTLRHESGRKLSDGDWYFSATIDHLTRIASNVTVLCQDPMMLRAAHCLSERDKQDANTILNKLVAMHQRYLFEWGRVLESLQSDYPHLRQWLRGSNLVGNS